VAFGQTGFSEPIFVVIGALRMKKSFSVLLLLILVSAISLHFSGCDSGNWFKSSAQGNGRTVLDPKKQNLPDEPEVTFKDLQGKDVTLASLKGKVVVINFWATWCEPCREEIPWLIGLQQKYSSKGFTFLGVAMDDEGKSIVEPFVEKIHFDVDGHPMTMNYPIVLGNDDISAKFGGLIGLPTSIVISRQGKIERRYLGPANPDDLEKDIESLLRLPQEYSLSKGGFLAPVRASGVTCHCHDGRTRIPEKMRCRI
jgi:thiol-disulfide isomerase/thioredoxin